MKLYNSILGTDYTREEFVEKVFAKGECTPERKVFFDVNRRTMVELAELFANAVREVNPKGDVAIMTSGPMQHSLEARDWDSLYKALSYSAFISLILTPRILSHTAFGRTLSFKT